MFKLNCVQFIEFCIKYLYSVYIFNIVKITSEIRNVFYAYVIYIYLSNIRSGD